MILLILLIGGGIFGLPIIALVVATRANRRAKEALDRLRLLKRRLEPEIAPPPAPVAPRPPPAPAPKPPPAPLPEPSAAPAPPPPPPPRPAKVARAPSPSVESLEEKIGLFWFTRIGALVGIVAAGWFFKYTIDNEWIGPWGRVAVGALAGVALLAWGEMLARGKKPTHFVFVQGVLGLGLALLLVTSYASFAFYDLLPLPLTFAIVALLCVFGGALAIHHRAESILVLSLLAAFLNPVMLSTGVDRALVLFSYLFVMTGAALAVAVKLRFRIATWVAVAGTTFLYMGWYQRFFEAHPPPEPGVFDRPPSELQGAYFPLAARWVPFLFALLFPLLWSLAGVALRRVGPQRTPLALYLVAAMGAHAAFAALLYDHPELLGGVLCALGAACAALFVSEGRGEWLGLPMAASFVVLAGVSAGLEREAPLTMMVLTGGLSAIYFGVIFRTSRAADRLGSALTLVLLGGAGLGFALLGALWLLPDHVVMFGLLLTGLSAVFLAVALAAGSAFMMAAAFVVSLLGLTLTGTTVTETRTGFLIVAALWFLLYVTFLCYELFVRGVRWTPMRLAVLAGAGLGYTMLWLTVTPESADLLRAFLSAATGAVYLRIGLHMLKVRPEAENQALLPLGLALVFFTLAVPFLLSGPSITVTWAIEGAVLAYLAARARYAGREGQPAWLVASMAVFAVAVIRMLVDDLAWIPEQYRLFADTDGAEGTLLPTPFLHPRAWALLALGVSLLMAARLAASVRERASFRRASLVFVILGHVAVLFLLIGEVRLLLTTAPFAFPHGLPTDEFHVKLRDWSAALADQRARLDMITTVVLGAYAAAVVGFGFATKHVVHRLVGIALFGVALLKLGLWDIWELETLHKIAVGGAIAALLLGSGFLYARFGARIKTLLAEGETLPLWLVALLLLPATARATEPERYAQERAIRGVTEPGDHRFDVDVALYGASLSDLADIRIAGPHGDEVPFVCRRVWTRPRYGLRGRVLNPVTLPDASTRVLLDFGRDAPEHERVVLEIDHTDYLRRTRVESSEDGRTFGVLVEGGYVFDLATGGPRAVRTWIRYPTTHCRYLRVTLLPGEDRQALRIRKATLPPIVRPPARPYERRVPLPFAGPPVTAGGKTVYRLAALPTGVPLERIDLEVDTPEFVRRVTLEASTRQEAWFRIGGGVLYRVRQAQHRPPRVDEALSLQLVAADRPFVRVAVQDGDDPPLAVRAVSGRYPAEEIVFRAPVAGPHTLYVGRKGDRAPRYDLADLLHRGAAAPPRPAELGALRENPLFAGKPTGVEFHPWTERYETLLHVIVGAVVLALAFWTLRLLRRAGRGPT
ncbi:MAG: DUF2339 domain-containing protein [Planctomycetota bacterium]